MWDLRLTIHCYSLIPRSLWVLLSADAESKRNSAKFRGQNSERTNLEKIVDVAEMTHRNHCIRNEDADSKGEWIRQDNHHYILGFFLNSQSQSEVGEISFSGFQNFKPPLTHNQGSIPWAKRMSDRVHYAFQIQCCVDVQARLSALCGLSTNQSSKGLRS